MTEENLWNTIEADADAFEDLTTEASTELAGLIRQVGKVQTDLVRAEENLKLLKRNRDRYLHELIPQKMQETGLEKVVVGGNSVSLATFVSATLHCLIYEKSVRLTLLRTRSAFHFLYPRIIVLVLCKRILRKKVLTLLQRLGSNLRRSKS